MNFSSLSLDDSCYPILPEVPAHHQFLPDQGDESFEGLKGQQHEDDFFFGSWNSPEAIAEDKRRGSWILGLVNKHTESNDGNDSNDSNDNNDVSGSSDNNDAVSEDVNDINPPGLVRSTSNSSLSSYDSRQSTTTASTTTSSSTSSSKKGVSFNESVRVVPIPHSSTYSHFQRRKMYASSQEVRANKIRNKKEYKYDGRDWRNATEEWEMSVDMVTGELIHPAHENVHYQR